MFLLNPYITVFQMIMISLFDIVMVDSPGNKNKYKIKTNLNFTGSKNNSPLKKENYSFESEDFKNIYASLCDRIDSSNTKILNFEILKHLLHLSTDHHNHFLSILGVDNLLEIDLFIYMDFPPSSIIFDLFSLLTNEHILITSYLESLRSDPVFKVESSLVYLGLSKIILYNYVSRLKAIFDIYKDNLNTFISNINKPTIKSLFTGAYLNLLKRTANEFPLPKETSLTTKNQMKDYVNDVEGLKKLETLFHLLIYPVYFMWFEFEDGLEVVGLKRETIKSLVEKFEKNKVENDLGKINKIIEIRCKNVLNVFDNETEINEKKLFEENNNCLNVLKELIGLFLKDK